MITYDDFAKLDLRIAKITAAEAHPNADRLIVLQIDMGDEQRQIVAGLRQWYTPEEMVGMTIVVVANLEPARLRGVESNGMLLAVDGEERVALLTTTDDAAAGAKVH